MLNQHSSGDRPHPGVRIYAFFLLAIGLVLATGGVYLLSLGGARYYFLVGLVYTFAACLLWRGRRQGGWLCVAVLLASCLWSWLEVGLSFWPSVPRLIGPLVLAATALLLMPLMRHKQGWADAPRSAGGAGRAIMAGLCLSACFVAFLLLMFSPHDIRYNRSVSLVPGSLSAVTLDAKGNWLENGRTGEGARYAPFDQIQPSNINQLEVAWVTRTGYVANQRRQEQEQSTPLYIDGTVYHCAPRGQITALDGITGKVKWQFDPKADSDDWKRCRALAYYDPGDGDECGPRVIETTVDARLIAVRAANGEPCAVFGDRGEVDLAAGMGNVDIAYLVNSSGAVVVGDKIILGGRVTDNVSVGEPSGVIRAYNARSGELEWVWDMGQPSLKGLPPADGHYTPGTPNAWSFLSYDKALGLVYVPLGNATPDIYGGHRRAFDEEYSSSVVALDVDSGELRWHFQTTKHDLWDYDLPSQPVLADIPDGNGGTLPGLIQTTKRAEIFVLDRRTGTPIKKVEYRKAPAPDGRVKGERYAAEQPYSVEMASVGTARLTEKDMWGATFLDQMLCRIRFRQLRYDGDLTTPSTEWTLVYPGPLGGMNYGSVAVDQANNVMVAVDMRFPLLQRLVPRAEISSDMKYTGESGPFAPMAGTPYGMQRRPFMSVLGIPCVRPSWGFVNAIDLASGKQLWQQPAGTMKDLSLGNFQPGIPFYVGLPPLGGPMVSAGGIAWFAGSQDYYLRAYAIESGKLLWQQRLPTGSQGTPISYLAEDGRQYVVVAAGGARDNANDWGDYLIAYALPRAPMTHSTKPKLSANELEGRP